MGALKNMTLALDRALTPAIGCPARTQTASKEQQLNIFVVFTSVDSTLEALKEAASLASARGGKVTLLVPQVVPYHLPLESPPVLLDFNEKKFSLLASQSPVETNVLIYLCRDKSRTLASVVQAGSLVILGGRKRAFWPTADETLSRELSRAGLEVIFKQTQGERKR